MNCPTIALSAEGASGISATVSEDGQPYAYGSTCLNPGSGEFVISGLDGGHADAIEGQPFSMDVATFSASGPMAASMSVDVNSGPWPAEIESTGGDGYVVVASVSGNWFQVGKDQLSRWVFSAPIRNSMARS